MGTVNEPTLTPTLEREMREAAAHTGERGYERPDGSAVTLTALCQTEPAWAANRIRHERGLLGIALTELDRLRAENAGLARDKDLLIRQLENRTP